MRIEIQSIHFKASDRLKMYVQEKCKKIFQLYDYVVDTQVFLKVVSGAEKANKLVEIKLNVPGDTLVVHNQSLSFEAAVDNAVQKLKLQLIKYKEKARTA